MKKAGFWFAVMTTVVVPLVRSMLAQRRRKRSRLQNLAASAADAGESALDTLSDLTESALEQIGLTGKGSRRHTGASAGLVDTTAALISGAPRLVAQLRGDDDGYPYRGREDWRKYGNVFDR
ncbi:MAG: hypothetical protein AB7R89_21065 [Dehalococcoidia bacterium]